MRLWVCSILAACYMLFPSVCHSNEQDDLEKLENYIKILSDGNECVKDYKDKYNAVKSWIKRTFVTNTEYYINMQLGGVLYYSMLNKINHKENKCDEIIKKWDNTDWPEQNLQADSGNKLEEDTENTWRFSEITSKMDGVIGIACSNESVDEVISLGGEPKKGTFIVRCKDNSTDAYIVWPNYLGHDEITVETKIDNSPIQKKIWISSTQGNAAFSPNPIKWLKSLKGAEKMIVRLTPFRENSQELIFNVTGIDEVIDKVSTICKWKK